MRDAPNANDTDLVLQGLGGSAGGRRRLELLQAIEATGSITRAAKAVGLSYKGAWDAVDAMNNLADGALVHRVAGGHGGGGTRLTARGRELLALYEKVQAEQRQLVARIERDHAQVREDLPVLQRLSMLSSARNQLGGRVCRLDAGAVNDEVELEIAGGGRIVATITRESTRTLRLKVGAPVTALIKASWIVLALPGTAAFSAANQLGGSVRGIKAGAVNSEVGVALPGGQTLVAIVSRNGVAELGLRRGRPVVALFNASSVILVRTD